MSGTASRLMNRGAIELLREKWPVPFVFEAPNANLARTK